MLFLHKNEKKNDVKTSKTMSPKKCNPNNAFEHRKASRKKVLFKKRVELNEEIDKILNLLSH